MDETKIFESPDSSEYSGLGKAASFLFRSELPPFIWRPNTNLAVVAAPHDT